MANTLLTSDIIARAALANLYETTVMAPLVHRDYSPEFGRKVGDTITVRKPTTFTAEEYVRADGITIQTATETSVPVVLNHFADVSFAVTSEELTLELQDFNDQLLNPAMEAISQKIDRDILSLRDDITAEVGGITGELAGDPTALVAAGRVLTQANVPFTERRAVTGPIIAAEWLKDDLLHRADKSGTTAGLRDASIGRLFGFDTYQTQNINTTMESDEGEEVGVAFHRTAFALVTVPLALPRGAANASIANYKGFALRVVIAYDNDAKQDVVSIDTLYGTKTLDANRAVLISANAPSS
jgi:hypothetical protein